MFLINSWTFAFAFAFVSVIQYIVSC